MKRFFYDTITHHPERTLFVSMTGAVDRKETREHWFILCKKLHPASLTDLQHNSLTRHHHSQALDLTVGPYSFHFSETFGMVLVQLYTVLEFHHVCCPCWTFRLLQVHCWDLLTVRPVSRSQPMLSNKVILIFKLHFQAPLTVTQDSETIRYLFFHPQI